MFSVQFATELTSLAAPRTVLQAATHTIPIVFMQVNDPVEQGFVATLARPGGNTTGFTQISAELDPKRHCQENGLPDRRGSA